MIDSEIIVPNRDIVAGMPYIYPASPTTHYPHVNSLLGLPHNCRQEMAYWATDRYGFTTPTQQLEGIQRLRIYWLGFRNNSSCHGKIIVNGYQTADMYPSGYQTNKFDWMEMSVDPSDGLAWTMAKVNNLDAGFMGYDSGMPSGYGCSYYRIVVVWVEGKIITLPIKDYVGTGCTLQAYIAHRDGVPNDGIWSYFTTAHMQVRFNWGTTIAYGNNTAWQNNSDLDYFSAPIAGLNPLLKYHYRAHYHIDGNSVSGLGVDKDYYGDDMTIPNGFLGRIVSQRDHFPLAGIGARELY